MSLTLDDDNIDKSLKFCFNGEDMKIINNVLIVNSKCIFYNPHLNIRNTHV